MKYLVLYNPHADNENGEENAFKLRETLPNDSFEFFDMTQIGNYGEFFANSAPDLPIILCGGDGTINRFANDTADLRIERELYYCPCGSGNDFARDVGVDGLIPMTQYLNNLPTVTVNGKDFRFINGIGFGIDGYCCEVGDRLRESNPKKKINYTAIAIKGLLFHYRPTSAVITVDGKTYSFDKVWLAPVMHGRFYGGGMSPTPDQQRNGAEGKTSVMVFHGSSKLKTLYIFPSIFKGEHLKYDKNVTVLSGNTITVKFAKPRPLQIDGETVKNVTEYTVSGTPLAAETEGLQTAVL